MTKAQRAAFGRRLRAARSIRSQAFLGWRAGTTKSAIAHMEAGRKLPSVPVLVQLSAALQVSTDWLLTGAGGVPIDWRVNEASANIELSRMPGQEVEGG